METSLFWKFVVYFKVTDVEGFFKMKKKLLFKLGCLVGNVDQV